jgi:cephalosporin hydroxylase
MHKSAYETGGKFLRRYWRSGMTSILEIGSMDVNGTLRDFQPESSSWLGVDLEAGLGVDVVLDGTHVLPFSDAEFDLVIASSVFEHDPFFWKTFTEMVRVTKPNGYIYINAPSNGVVHRYPLDIYRFYPDAGHSLQRWAQIEYPEIRLVESFIAEQNYHPGEPLAAQWNDFTAVYQRGKTEEKSYIFLDTNARNIWVEGLFDNATFNEVPQDKQIIEHLKRDIYLHNVKSSESTKDSTHPIVQKGSPLDRDFSSEIPLELLQNIQVGTMQYKYKGISCLKDPFDFALYQKLLWELKPRTIIEIGSHTGGSGLWLADLLRSWKFKTKIYSFDITPPVIKKKPRKLKFHKADVYKLDESILTKVLENAQHPILIIEDGPHTFEGSLNVLNFANKYLKSGDYVIIEDGIVFDLKLTAYEDGPNRAIRTFLANNSDRYEIDTEYCDFYGQNVTWNTNGYIKCIK